jgi:2-polyprenyl-3-methyl-5-hydroxy-6-metoxy-1,4-benzoquinol methylase
MRFHSEARIRGTEILDTGTVPDEEVRKSLGDLRRINAWLGGMRLSQLLIEEQVRRAGLARFSLLDVGTGSGDLPEFVTRRFNATVVGLDRQPRHMSRNGADHGASGWTRVAGEILAMPFARKSFDIVTASLVLHHFDDDAAVAALVQMAELARHAVLINDLERHTIAWHFIRHVPFVASEVSRIDGSISVQQAFAKKELEQLAIRAGFTRYRVRKHVPFRLSLAVELS